MSLAGMACFIRIEKYKPAGPPPRQTMRIAVSFRSGLIPFVFILDLNHFFSQAEAFSNLERVPAPATPAPVPGHPNPYLDRIQ
jgi:hypothetical protein